MESNPALSVKRKRKLSEQVSDVIRLKHFSYRTQEVPVAASL
jgi:hypothetical protein